MKSRRPSRSFVICLLILGLSGAAGGWAWSKANSAPMHVRNSLSFLELLRYQKPDPPFELPTPEMRARTRAEVLAFKAKLVAEFPELAIEERPVPTEENGFLQLHLLTEADPSPKLGQELKSMLEGHAPWDRAAVEKGLEEHAGLVSEFERIAALERRSSAAMPAGYTSFIHARVVKAGADLLMAKARLAAEAGDEEEALRLVAATQNLASHLREIESPTLLGETVVILLDLAMHAQTLEKLLPAIGPEANLPRWQAVLGTRSYEPADLAKVMRGEWHAVMEHMLLPVVLDKENPNSPPEGEELARAMTGAMRDQVEAIRTGNLAELLDLKEMPAAADYPGLSKRSREVMRIFLVGADAWGRGFVRASRIIARNEAVLELLLIERTGTELTEETMSRVARDPLTGLPFTWDADARQVGFAAGAEDETPEAVTLPW